MKKTILMLVLIMAAFMVKAQRVWEWSDSINLGAMVAADTIKQPSDPSRLPMGPYVWSCQVDAEDLNADNSKFYIGGGNMTLRDTLKSLFKFDPIAGDSIPKTLNRTALSDIQRNGGVIDTTYTWTNSGDRFFFDMPMIRVTKGGVTDGWVKWTFKFYKP